MKQHRLDHLRGKLARTQEQYAAGHVSYCRGGRPLARARLHLRESEYADTAAWRRAWENQRQRTFSAAGEPGKTGGNETIRVSVGGYLEIDLPAALRGQVNAPRGRYRLATPITFTHRRQEHENAATTRHSISYRVRYDAARERWYVDASFSPTHPDRPDDLRAIRAGGIVSVDLNEQHVSVARVDQHGNLSARPFDLPLDLTGSTSRRDAQLREAFSRIIAYAKQHECAVAIEDLNFEDEKAVSRESYRKRFRRTLAGLPTGIVRERLRSMTATAGVPLLAADPAYTSKDGKAHWAKPLDLTTHQAAALCIGRRALDLRLSRRACTPAPDQRIEAGERLAAHRSGPITRIKSAQTHPGTITRQTSARAHAARTRDPGIRDRSSRPKTVRGRRRAVARPHVGQNSTG
jgi:IS605 OrfB family transposase